jgi:hypothetical protein
MRKKRKRENLLIEVVMRYLLTYEAIFFMILYYNFDKLMILFNVNICNLTYLGNVEVNFMVVEIKL